MAPASCPTGTSLAEECLAAGAVGPAEDLAPAEALQRSSPLGPAPTSPAEEPSAVGRADPASEEITLRFRFGLVAVKCEVADEEQLARAPCGVAELPVEAASAAMEDASSHLDAGEDAIRLICRLGVTRVKVEAPLGLEAEPAEQDGEVRGPQGERSSRSAPSAAATASPLQELFQHQTQAQQQAAQVSSGSGPERAGNEQPEGDAAAQLEEAQIASYDINVNERRAREARNLELVEQGNLEPLEALDEEFMMLLFAAEGMLAWLESAEHRLLVFRYLQLQSQAVKWYREHAEVYFSDLRRRLEELLEQPDAAIVVPPVLAGETEKVQAAMFAMPEKGHFAPTIFAPCAAQGALAGLAGVGGPVELD